MTSTQTPTMRETIVHPTPTLHTTIQHVPIPTPAPNEVVIKVFAAGSNVKDWDHLTSLNLHLNSGDDIAGTIHAVGADAQKAGFKEGERVAAMHTMLAPGGAYAEFAVARAGTTLRIPEGMNFEEAATIPLVVLTAGVTLFRRQGLPPPWDPVQAEEVKMPLIVYGASSAVGCFAIKLARASGIHPIIAVAGRSHDYVETLLDTAKGDKLVDYRNGVEQMKRDVAAALGGLKVEHAVDCISSGLTWVPLAQLVDPEGGVVSVVSGANRYDEPEIPEGVRIVYTYVGTIHEGAYKPSMPKQDNKGVAKGDPAWAKEFLTHLSEMLERRKMDGHPYEVIPGGLLGIEEGLNRLKAGEARGKKFVYVISED